MRTGLLGGSPCLSLEEAGALTPGISGIRSSGQMAMLTWTKGYRIDGDRVNLDSLWQWKATNLDFFMPYRIVSGYKYWPSVGLG